MLFVDVLILEIVNVNDHPQIILIYFEKKHVLAEKSLIDARKVIGTQTG